MSIHGLRTWLRRLVTPVRAKRRGERRPTPQQRRPALELLEDRVVPSGLQPGPTISEPEVSPGISISTEGQAVRAGQTLLQFEDTDPGALTHLSATITWGDGIQTAVTSASASTAVIVDTDTVDSGNGAEIYQVQSLATGAHVYEEAAAGNIFQVSVIDDGFMPPAGSTAASTPLNGGDGVADPAVVLSTTPLTLTAVGEGTPTGTVTVATFTDPGNPTTTGTDNDSATEYSASIDWGDGTTPTTVTSAVGGGIVWQNTAGGVSTWAVQGGHTYAEEGSYNISVTVTHEALAAVGPDQTATITVNDQQLTNLASANLPAAAQEGAAVPAFSGIATFTDPAGVGVEPTSDFTATINWGDATTSPGTVVFVTSDAGGAEYRVDAPAHTYVEEGTYTVNVTLTHDALAALTTPNQTITIADQQITALVAANLPASTPKGVSVAALTGLATFTDPAGVGVEPVGDFTATIDWGDTTNSAGTVVSLGGGSYRVDAPAHTYAQEGSYRVIVSVQHDALAPVASNALTILVIAPATVSVYEFTNSTWDLRNSNSPGAPDATFQYGSGDSVPVIGDWDGDHTATIGAVDVVANTVSTDPNAPRLLQWSLRNSDSAGAADITFLYGKEGDIPVVGDWDGDGVTTIGVFEPDTGVWKLRNSNSQGAPDITFTFGAPGDIPVVGDWDGDGTTTIGVVDPTTMTWQLRNSNSAGAPDLTFTYGQAGNVPVTGDWNGDRVTTIGVFLPATATWQLRNSNSAGAPDIAAFQFGASPNLSKPPTATYATGNLVRASDGVGAGGTDVPTLTQADLDAAQTEAVARLRAAGVSDTLLGQLSSATFQVGTLSGPVLAKANPYTNTAVLSVDAAGHGWFIDPTPDQDEEFAAAPWGALTAQAGTAAVGRIDLLTVVLREMGNLVGLPDLPADSSAEGLMANLLGEGNRLTTGLDQVFANAHS